MITNFKRCDGMLKIDEDANVLGASTFNIFDFLLESELKNVIGDIFDKDSYDKLKLKFCFNLEESKTHESELSAIELKLLMGLLDFTSKLFVSEKGEYLDPYFSEAFSMNLSEFKDFKKTYNNLTTTFFTELKEVYKDDKEMLKNIVSMLEWKSVKV